MVEVLVWLLLVTPVYHKGGMPQTVERFKTQAQCEHVRTQLRADGGQGFTSGCVQANILVPKGGTQ